jgi:exonuclease SbcC
MKIVAIRVKNLASLEGVSEIDFTKEPLRSAGIFAITGPTGAGKSTLLDALCLALFSKTPRHLQARESGIELQDGTSGKISQGDVRGILRKGSPDGYAEVEFIGLDGNRYQSTWSVRRSRNKAEGSLQPDTMELINKTTNSIFPEKKTGILKEIERLVGLNFEQFSRSVLLAQGDFTAFLKADKDEKSSLLEKLTGTDIYSSISKLIYEKFKQAEQELDALTKQKEDILLLSDEELQLFHQQLEDLEGKINALETEKNLLTTEITWFQTLEELKRDKESAEIIWHHAEKEKEEASDRINYFLLAESVQDSKRLFESRAGIKSLEEQKTSQLSKLQRHITLMNIHVTVATENMEKADSLVLKRETEYNDALPDIEKAKVLDTLIKEKNTQLIAVKKEESLAEEKKQNHLLKLQHKEKEILLLTEQLAGLDKWKTENSSRQPVAGNIVLISSKLDDLDKFSVLQKTITGKIDSIQVQNNQITTTIRELEKEVTVKDKKLQELTTAFRDKNDLLSALVIEEIKNKLTTVSPALEKTISAKGCWELLYTTMQNHDNLLSKLASCQKELVTQKEELARQNNNLREALLKRDQAQKLLSIARLENDKDVENMRAQLTQEIPCPVCGSTHHPYAGNNSQLHDLLEGITHEFKECAVRYEDLLKENSRLDQLCRSLEQEKINLEKEAVFQSVKIKEITLNWETLEPDKNCTDLPPAERLSWLNEVIDHLRNKIKGLQDQENNYNQLKVTTDLQKKEIEILEKELTVVKDQLKDSQREQLNTGNELARVKAELKQNGDTIDKIRQSIDPFFAQPGWISKWQQDPDSFQQKIKTFAEEWNHKMQLLESGYTQSALLNTELQGLNDQLKSFDSEVKNSQSKLTDLEKDYSSLLEQRKILFNGEATAMVEVNFKQSIEWARLIQTARKSEKDQVETTLAEDKATEGQLNKDILSFKNQVADLSRQIHEWIQQYNRKNTALLEEETLSRLLDHTPDWMADERKYLTRTEEVITKSKATYEERALQLSGHLQKKVSDRSAEDTQEKLASLKTMLDTAIHEKNEITFRIRQDTDHKKRVGALLSEIEAGEALYANWQKLNELLGSADGKKFRQIAQEYTLDTLLGYANIHLQVLSSRYQLSKVPDSLALQIKDKDMGDEIRSVHSLSGGESFLVSLALALGLSHLSSNRMKVESLFIDEGFGSLDPATLSIAMDALERLHNQGRKVGVISHVQEMTERIPTQIRVLKLPNGKSKIEVTGGI